MYIKRELEKIIKNGAKQVPVIAIIGPRQSGKSTLAKEMFPNHTYLDMQDAELFEFANSDPKGFLKHIKMNMELLIDEAQYTPTLFPQIKVEADKNPRPGYFIFQGHKIFFCMKK